MSCGPAFQIGQVVEVHAFGHWYEGVVVKLTPKRATVRYTTGTGRTRDKAISFGNRWVPWQELLRRV